MRLCSTTAGRSTHRRGGSSFMFIACLTAGRARVLPVTVKRRKRGWTANAGNAPISTGNTYLRGVHIRTPEAARFLGTAPSPWPGASRACGGAGLCLTQWEPWAAQVCAAGTCAGQQHSTAISEQQSGQEACQPCTPQGSVFEGCWGITDSL